MEDKKKGNGVIIAITVILCILVGALGWFFGSKFYENDNCNETKTEENNDGSCLITDTKNIMHVYDRISNKEGYNLYSFLENQGYTYKLVEYKEEIYLVTEYNQSSCVSKLFEGGKFNDKILDCTEYEGTVGSVFKFDIKTSDVKNAYLLQTFRTDGATAAIFVFNDGTATKYEFVDNMDITKDLFKGEKVKEIINYSCDKSGEDGCDKEKYTVILQNGAEKELIY